MDLETFKEKFDELLMNEKIAIYREYLIESDHMDDEISDFDEYFFETFFQDNPYEAARATHFGKVNWSDPYIRFNAYGNLETMSDYDVQSEAEDHVEEIYEYPYVWESYINEDDEDEEEEDEEENDED